MPTAIEKFLSKLEKQKLPRFVYKYLRFDKYTLPNLNKKILWFSDPSNFNDPFDSRIIPQQSYSSDDIIKYNEWRMSNDLPYMHPDDIKDNIEWNERDPEGWAKSFHEKINETTVSVCCFSRDQNNILMWSHYADGHKGLCLEFDTSEDTDFFRPVGRYRSVKYSNKCKADNYLRDTAGTLHNMICTKSKYWKYENEVRIMRLNKPKGLQEYNKRTLKSVTFGCRTTDSDIALTRKILGDTVEYKRCELDEKSRRLKIVPLSL